MDLKEEISRKKIKIGGEDALRVEFTRVNTPAGKTEVIIYVLHKGRIYRIFPSSPEIKPEDLNPGDTTPYTDVQDAILSSFKFID
ncbi:MAG: hypothetical protein A2126_01640 [Candidatus Woykebacteria bacterium GWB1_45_5]|uniref:Uncharacterized protein n=2 Tax=Candidatus Woykeibacteriota TaxID=1817899 RepID=A0A1G1W4R2_9BACT|nr:MAG: hypothetical protein A2113_02155 [Candidatus Woykebacteria bacterium GWA1_44_8]OGY23109.1 MAG: hypothetical protein A2126_01640 [Candidatus Woykebacteria bacterium GWB1_45_5]